MTLVGNSKSINIADTRTDQYQILNELDHVKTRAMYSGTFERTDKTFMMKDITQQAPTPCIVKTANKHSNALIKIIDEVISNAIDSAIRTRQVTGISVNFHRSGHIEVINIGTGISVKPWGNGQLPNRNNTQVLRIPEVIFTHLRAGSNFNSKSHTESGINGMGVKITCIHSSEFYLETVDPDTRELYTQSYLDGLNVINDYSLTQLPQGCQVYTRVVFKPEYTRFEYFNAQSAAQQQSVAHSQSTTQQQSTAQSSTTLQHILHDADYIELTNIIRLRSYYASLYLSEAGLITQVLFNNQLLRCEDSRMMLSLLSNIPVSEIHIWKYTDPKTGMFMNVAIALKPKKPERNRCYKASVVNGCVVYLGDHFSYISSSMANICTAKANAGTAKKSSTAKSKASAQMSSRVSTTAKTPKSAANSNSDVIELVKYRGSEVDTVLSMFISTRLEVSDWGAQSKEKLSIKKEVLAKFDITTASFCKDFAANIITRLSYIDPSKRVSVSIPKAEMYQKYTEAKNVTKGKKGCTLLICEGDAAKGLLRKLISVPGSVYNFDNTGLFSLGGVPPNIMKMIEDSKDNGDGIDGVNVANSLTQKFYESKRFTALMNVLGLTPGAEYNAQTVSKLPYSKIVICTDADLDGRGCICSLVLVFFHTLWPSLYSSGFINVWMSPVIRVLDSKNKVLAEFREEKELLDYEMPNKSCHIEYYKGLASHSNQMIERMSKRFEIDLIKIVVSESSAEIFEIYYGDDSTKRKTELSTPVDPLTKEEILNLDHSRSLISDRHLRIQTKDFMLYAIRRTIPGLDSMTPVRRKIVTHMLKSNPGMQKVYQWTGAIANSMKYHHGDMSMNAAITKMSQDFPGSNNYPLIISGGQSGSRFEGGADLGPPRYVSVKPNAKLLHALFDSSTISILPHNEEEGEIVEPKYFIPVIPLCLLETRQAVSYGWNHKIYARDLSSIVNVLQYLINGMEVPQEIREVTLSTKDFKGALFLEILATGKRVIHAIGLYQQVDHKTFLITELPLFVPPCKYMEIMDKKYDESIITGIRNYSTDTNIEIYIDINPEAIPLLSTYIKHIRCCQSPCIGQYTDFLCLHHTFTESYNFINEYGIIESFPNVYEIICRCFKLNSKMYEMRIDREMLLLRYLILRESNIIKFIEYVSVNDQIIKTIRQKNMDELETIFQALKLEPINGTILNTHQKYKTEELVVLLETNKTYDYIIRINVGDLSLDELTQRVAKMNEYQAKYDKLNAMNSEVPFRGVSWYSEDVMEVIKILSTK